MLFRSFIAFLVVIGSSLIIGTSAAAASRGVAGLVAAGYKIVDVQWEIAPVPGGQLVHLNGTVQDIVAELTKLNPNWEADHKNYSANLTAANVEKHETTQTGVKKIKDEGRWGDMPCNRQPEKLCDAYMIMDGVAYLNKVPGEPGAGPGPKECGRVSCSWDAAIFWCNQNEDAVTLGSYKWIASGASYICSRCSRWDGSLVEKVVAGETLNSNNWSVQVLWDEC